MTVIDRTAGEQAAMLDSIRDRIAALDLDLDGLEVVTEAATGAYAVTAVIAAMAGARVTALARDTARHGSAEDAFVATATLAAAAGVGDRIQFVRRLDPATLATCDILTNSGHLRPIGAEAIGALPTHAVIALMFEAWEFRGGDLDLDACRQRGIAVAAVNERHPDVAVFPFLGPLAARLLADAGLDPAGRRVALLCDNPFARFIADGLVQAGAEAPVFDRTEAVPAGTWDAILVALDPFRNPPLGAPALAALRRSAPGALLAQFWGDVDRAAAAAAGFAIAPAVEPRPGHMAILLNALGFEPIVRLQAGGLRAAELVFRRTPPLPGGVAEILLPPRGVSA